MYTIPTPPDPLAHCPNPTLTISLSIPFILIGAGSVPDDIYHWTNPLKPLQVLHHMLSTQNPTIPLRLSNPLPPASPNDPPQLPDPASKHTWTIHSDPNIHLTQKQTRLLPPGAWTLGLTLSTPQTPFQNPHWRRALRALLNTLQADFNDPHPDFPFRLLCDETCNLRLGVGPGEEWCEAIGGWSEESLERVMLGFVGFERVLVGVVQGGTLGNLVRFKSFARFFRQRRRRVGRRLERAKYLHGYGIGVGDSGTEMGDVEVEAEIDDALGWCGIVSDAASSSVGLRGLLEEMQCEGDMAVRFPTLNSLPSQSSETTDPAASNAAITALATEIVFASYPSTLEIDELEAYVELMTLFIDFCYWTSKEMLWEKMWGFHRLYEHCDRVTEPSARTEFMDMLGLGSGARRYWVEKASIGRRRCEVGDVEGGAGEGDRRSWWELERELGELGAVVERVEEGKRREGRLGEVFVRRYEFAGGFGGRDRRVGYEGGD